MADATQYWRIPPQLLPQPPSLLHPASALGLMLPESFHLGLAALHQSPACLAWEAAEGASLVAAVRVLLSVDAGASCPRTAAASSGRAAGAC